MYDVLIKYAGGRRSKVERHMDDLGEACAFVLKLADQLGADVEEGSDRAKWVEIHKDGRLEISVSVVGGGLVSRRDAEESRSI